MAGGIVVLLLVLAFVAIFVYQFSATRTALTTTRVESPLSPPEAAQLIHGAFAGARNALWTPGAGPGTINMRRRGKDGGIVMSIDIGARAGAGGSTVDMWASTYNEYLLVLANFAGSVNSRKKAISRLLTEGAPQLGPVDGRTDGAPAS